MFISRLKVHHRTQADVTTRFILAGDLYDFTGLSVGIGHLRELLVGHLLRQQVAQVSLDLDVLAKLLRDTQVDHVSRHLIAIRHTGIVLAAGASLATTYTDDTFTDAVIEQGDVQLGCLVLIEESGVDQVGRLSLHRAVLVA